MAQPGAQFSELEPRVYRVLASGSKPKNAIGRPGPAKLFGKPSVGHVVANARQPTSMDYARHDPQCIVYG